MKRKGIYLLFEQVSYPIYLDGHVGFDTSVTCVLFYVHRRSKEEKST